MARITNGLRWKISGKHAEKMLGHSGQRWGLDYLLGSSSLVEQTVCQRFFQSSKHLLNSISGIAFKAFFDSACVSAIVSKQCPRSGLLSLGDSQKSHGAKSGEFGGCGTMCVEFSVKWSRRTSAVWDGTLSWCINHELSAPNIFWNGVEWSSWNANIVSEVSNCQSTIFVH